MKNQENSRNKTLRRIQLLESNLAQVLEREQRVNQALEELKTAQEHVGKTENPMRMIGNILVSQPKQEIEEYIEKQRSQKQKNLEKIKESKKKMQDEVENLKEEIIQ